jgi:type II secretory pathway component PulF
MKRYPNAMERTAPVVFQIVIIMALMIGGALLFLSGPIGIALLIAIALTVSRAMRLSRQRAFLLMMSDSIDQRIPLIPALQAFGAEYSSWGVRTRRLAAALANGMVLPEALRLFPGLLPGESLPLIEAGHQSGRLSEAMRRAAEQSDRTSPLWQSLAGKTFYLTMLLLFMPGIGIFMMIWIVPKFSAIFQDFGARLPWLTRQMIGVSHFACNFGFLLVFVALAFGVLLVYGALCYLGLIRCDLPGTRWLTRRLDTATILDALAISTEAGRPMPEALTTLAARYPKRSVRNRLRQMWFRVAEGRDWCESLMASRLLRPAEAGVLQSAARAGNLPWAMREMADSNRRRFAYRLSAILQIVFPATLCTIGLVVGLYVAAFFLPLISLIEHLSK